MIFFPQQHLQQGPRPELSPHRLFDVSGLVAVVTGGGSGIGLMIATALENNGAIVYIVGRRLGVLQKAAEENNRFGNIIPLQGDITSRDCLLSLVETIKERTGYVDLLVNNAGIVSNMFQAPEPVSDIKAFQNRLWNMGTQGGWAQTFEINVTAHYYTTVAFLELLHLGNERRGPDAPTSQVIIMSSVGGFRRDDRVFSLSYGVSKAAVTHLGKSLANILRAWRIRTNIVAPGIYPSEMTDGLVNFASIPAEAVPLQRPGTIEDMGGLIMFLASRAGAYINGGVHLTDGGRLGLFSSTF